MRPAMASPTATASSARRYDRNPTTNSIEDSTQLETAAASSFLADGNSSWLERHDSTFSVTDDYQYQSSNDLNVWNGAALLCAECLGTGLLALPHNITVVLGSTFGLFFLILQFPINLYAGTILSDAALYVETKQARVSRTTENYTSHTTTAIAKKDSPQIKSSEQIGLLIGKSQSTSAQNSHNSIIIQSHNAKNYQAVSIDVGVELVDDNSLVDGDHHSQAENTDKDNNKDDDDHHQLLHHDTATFDFIGMTSALFSSKAVTRWIMALYYTNIFLVLGNYIVVMSHAVTALVGEDILCIPTAGILASTLMFAMSQLKTMARLGRSASAMSLTALGIVVAQCLYFAHYAPGQEDIMTQQIASSSHDNNGDDDDHNNNNAQSLLRKFSAMGSIGFAVGSQKLFLNIRHELADRKKAPSTLAVALCAFGSFYVCIVLAAGANPPGFLFDAIPAGTIQKRLAGFFLWLHVVVSYAINSQAICASTDRVFFYQWNAVRYWPDDRRWMVLTGIMAATAFFVANAIPFFKDLVSFIGSLTSVPLTMLLPAVYHRRVQGVPIWWPTANSLGSYSLLVFSIIFMVTATIGSIYSILSDWEHHTGGFFSCH